MFIVIAALFYIQASAADIAFNLKGQQFLERGIAGVTSDAEIIWDTSKDGPIASGMENCLGGLSKSGKKLICDSEKSKAVRDAAAAKEVEKASKTTRMDELKTKLKTGLDAAEISELMRLERGL